MSTFLAHHGTSLKDAKNIDRNGFINTTGRVGWLGTGAYFFWDDYELAIQWAKYRYKHEANAVIKCNINVSDEQAFDLRDPKSDANKKFHAMRKEMILKAKIERLNIKANDKKDFDGKLINIICKKDNYLIVIAHTYTYNEEDRELSMGSRFPNGIELCLRYTKKNCLEYISDMEILQGVI